jgi:hypothetical protein
MIEYSGEPVKKKTANFWVKGCDSGLQVIVKMPDGTGAGCVDRFSDFASVFAFATTDRFATSDKAVAQDIRLSGSTVLSGSPSKDSVEALVKETGSSGNQDVEYQESGHQEKRKLA